MSGGKAWDELLTSAQACDATTGRPKTGRLLPPISARWFTLCPEWFQGAGIGRGRPAPPLSLIASP